MQTHLMRSRASRLLAAMLAAVVLFSAVLVIRTARANADSQSVTMNASCTVLGITVALAIPIVTDDNPDPVTEGGNVALSVKASTPADTGGLAATINSFSFTIPYPSQVASVSNVTFSGGNFTGAYSAGASSVTVTLTGPVDIAQAVLPAFNISAAVKSGTAGQTITWKAPTAVTANVTALGFTVAAECTGDGSTLNTTPIIGAATTTTTAAPTTTTTTRPATTTTAAPTTTTTRPATTTTAAPTTTTTRPATTTTAAPTTTTTRPATTTTRPATTTTRPATTTTRPVTTTTKRATTTTTKNSGHWPPWGWDRWMKPWMCWMFRICR